MVCSFQSLQIRSRYFKNMPLENLAPIPGSFVLAQVNRGGSVSIAFGLGAHGLCCGQSLIQFMRTWEANGKDNEKLLQQSSLAAHSQVTAPHTDTQARGPCRHPTLERGTLGGLKIASYNQVSELSGFHRDLTLKSKSPKVIRRMMISKNVLNMEERKNNLGTIWTIQLSHTFSVWDSLHIFHYTFFFFSFLLIHSHSPERPNLQTFYQEAPKGYAKTSPPDQWAQVHGHIPEAAHLLLPLQRVYLVRDPWLPFSPKSLSLPFLWLCIISEESVIVKNYFWDLMFASSYNMLTQ
jgi:hypothetical protein